MYAFIQTCAYLHYLPVIQFTQQIARNFLNQYCAPYKDQQYLDFNMLSYAFIIACTMYYVHMYIVCTVLEIQKKIKQLVWSIFKWKVENPEK